MTVLGAKEQIADLIAEIVATTNLPSPVAAHLTASLQSLVRGFDPSEPLQRAAACLRLGASQTLVPFLARATQAAAWTADANRIRAVLAC